MFTSLMALASLFNTSPTLSSMGFIYMIVSPPVTPWLEALLRINAGDPWLMVMPSPFSGRVISGSITIRFPIVQMGLSTPSQTIFSPTTMRLCCWDIVIPTKGIRCRHGYFHVVNNDYTHWEMYAIGGRASPTINSLGNRFLAPANRFAKELC